MAVPLTIQLVGEVREVYVEWFTLAGLSHQVTYERAHIE